VALSFCGRMEHGYTLETLTGAIKGSTRDRQGYSLCIHREHPPDTGFLGLGFNTLSLEELSAATYDDMDEWHSQAWTNTTVMV